MFPVRIKDVAQQQENLYLNDDYGEETNQQRSIVQIDKNDIIPVITQLFYNMTPHYLKITDTKTKEYVNLLVDSVRYTIEFGNENHPGTCDISFEVEQFFRKNLNNPTWDCYYILDSKQNGTRSTNQISNEVIKSWSNNLTKLCGITLQIFCIPNALDENIRDFFKNNE